MHRFTIPGRGGHTAGINFGRTHGPIDLVFLHATGFCGLTYRRLLERLDPQRRVITLDLRGHGLTTLPARPFFLTHWNGYADDVIAAVRHLSGGSGPIGLIAGHSMGGTSALLALTRDPGIARALLLVDPALILPHMRRAMMLPFGPHLMRRRIPIARGAARRRAHFPDRAAVLKSYRGRGAFKTWGEGFLEDYVEDGFGPRADGSLELRCTPAWESATFAAHRHDLIEALRRLQVPARILVAEHGSTSARALDLIRAHAPAMVVEPVPGSSHFIPMERPDLVCERIVSLIEGLG